VGLDGIRGLAALYVVIYHIFVRAWSGYPDASHAPFLATWLSYGQAAVAIFIALSGFSLGLGPARSGWQFKSIGSYAHRRAWRILPPYWAALGFSLVLTWHVLAQPHLPVPNGKSVVVNGLLVQDVFAVGSPNRTFWSIAIEAQLYVLLPLLLLLVRRVSAWAMAGLVAAIVVTIGILGPHVALMNTALVKFTPDLAVLFAVGLLAAGIVTAGERTRSWPWAGCALAAAVPAIVLMVVRGSVWSYFNLSGWTWPGLRRSAASSPRSPPRARGSSCVSLTAACRGASAPAPIACTSRTSRSSSRCPSGWCGAGFPPGRRCSWCWLRSCCPLPCALRGSSPPCSSCPSSGTAGGSRSGRRCRPGRGSCGQQSRLPSSCAG
jgi:hypothetical protein